MSIRKYINILEAVGPDNMWDDHADDDTKADAHVQELVEGIVHAIDDAIRSGKVEKQILDHSYAKELLFEIPLKTQRKGDTISFSVSDTFSTETSLNNFDTAMVKVTSIYQAMNWNFHFLERHGIARLSAFRYKKKNHA